MQNSTLERKKMEPTEKKQNPKPRQQMGITKGVDQYFDDAPSEFDEEPDPTSEPEAKWGDAIKAGYQVLPDALIRGQHLLRLSATDIVVIANLNQAWWFSGRLPYLQPHTIAKRMGVSERSVQRSLSRLRGKRLLRQVRERQDDGTVRYYHDLSGLRAQLEQLARRDIRYSESRRAGTAD